MFPGRSIMLVSGVHKKGKFCSTMTLETSKIQSDSSWTPKGVTYDTHTATLVGNFHDEMAAYRTRRTWAKILQEHFLLELGRDYEVSIRIDSVNGRSIVECCFTSACGRYAFWRLLNKQAPEAAEELLKVAKVKKAKRKDSASQPQHPWILQGYEESNSQFVESIKSLLKDIAKKFS